MSLWEIVLYCTHKWSFKPELLPKQFALIELYLNHGAKNDVRVENLSPLEIVEICIPIYCPSNISGLQQRLQVVEENVISAIQFGRDKKRRSGIFGSRKLKVLISRRSQKDNRTALT